MATTSTTLTSWALLIWKALQAKGCDSHSVFKQADLDPSKLGDGNARYRLSDMTKLWTAAVEETRDPCFGLEVGKLWTPTTFHALGFAWLASHSLKGALDRLVRYSRIVNNSLCIGLEPHGAYLHLTIDSSEDQREIHDAAHDAGLIAIVVMCRLLVGENFSAVEVQVPHKRTTCTDKLERFIGASIIPDCDNYIILFDRMRAERRLATGNSELAKINEEVAMKYLSSIDRSSILMRTKSILIELMPAGQVTESAIAAEMNMSLRTLQRKLSDEGTSFSEVYKAIRKDMANEYIQDSQMSISEIAYLLGFSEQANFTRAFRRWYGASPSDYRKNIEQTAVL